MCKISCYTSAMPINLAIVYDCYRSVRKGFTFKSGGFSKKEVGLIQDMGMDDLLAKGKCGLMAGFGALSSGAAWISCGSR